MSVPNDGCFCHMKKFKPCYAESFYVLHSSIFILLTCSIPVVRIYLNQSGNIVDPDQMA